MRVLTIEELLAGAPIGPVDTDDDDVALMQLTSGSTGSPKAVQITHANFVANAEAMVVGCNFDIDTDVIVSWLPCFHDMGMTGYLTVPMYFGAELVKVTPMDFLRDTLLWAKLIDKYKGTMTAAPNFAYNLFAKRLRRQATPGEFDLSSLRWALSGAEQVDPLDVEDLCDAGAPFGLRPEAIIPAYGMAETTVAVSFSECGGAWSSTRWTPTCWPSCTARSRRPGDTPGGWSSLGKPLNGLEVRIVDEDGCVLPARGVGVIEVRGEPVTKGYTTAAGFIPAQDEQGWYDTGDLGYLTETGNVVVCGRVKDVIIMAGRNIYPTDIERAACRVAGVRPGCAVAVRLDAGQSRETFAVAVESKEFEDHDRGAPHRASGGPRGVRRGRRPAPQCGGARAGDDSQDPVGKAAARARPGAGELIGRDRFCARQRVNLVCTMAEYDAQPGREAPPQSELSAAQLRGGRGGPVCRAERGGRDGGRRPRGDRCARRRGGVRGAGHTRRRRRGCRVDRSRTRARRASRRGRPRRSSSTTSTRSSTRSSTRGRASRACSRGGRRQRITGQ